MEGDLGPNPSDVFEAEQMRKYNEWINSDDPSAVAERKANEEKQQQYITKQKQEELDYVEFLRNNPDVVQKCKEQATKQLESITERYLRAAFESNKIKEYIKSKYKQ